jgi:pSer/pThr/pTyr-binding forkhead associated (FHA) protein
MMANLSKCEKGHTMDPSWRGECPYCKAEEREKMRGERGEGEMSSLRPAGDAKRGSTKIYQEGEAWGQSQSSSRRIVGFLVTYTWRHSGDYYVLREGRNFIGRDKASSYGDQDCDVRLPYDREMSSEHALILYQMGQFTLYDQKSANGTFVNERDRNHLVPPSGVELEDKNLVLAGSTAFIFVEIPPPVSDVARPHEKKPKPAERQPKPEGKDRNETTVM